MKHATECSVSDKSLGQKNKNKKKVMFIVSFGLR